MSDRATLVKQARDLNLVFAKNISTLKLEELILTTLEAETTPTPVDEILEVQKDAKEESQDDDDDNDNDNPPTQTNSKLSALALRRQAITNAKAKAMELHVVTLTNRDNRENDFMTTAYLSFENQFFGLSKLVPLDVAVQLEQALIDIAEATMIPLHKDEIVDGKRTGNKITVQVKKFAISYSR